MTFIESQLAYLNQTLTPGLSLFIQFIKADKPTQYALLAMLIAIVVLIVLHLTRKKTDEALRPDMSAIAGEDLMATQLDLAKAYIEMDNKDLAEKLLKEIAKNGNKPQQKAAKQLLEAL